MTPTLAGVPSWIRYLSTFPTADRVVDALACGPLARCGARTALLWQLRGEEALVAVGAFGHTADELGRYGSVPLVVDSLATRAARAGSIQVDGIAPRAHSTLSTIDAAMLDLLVERTGATVAVNVPIVHAGRVVGAFGFASDRAWDPHGHERVVVGAVASALATWMTHPRSAVGSAAVTTSRDWSLDFSERQREVLRRVDDGLSTTAIAKLLGVSDSSIKADLRRAMRALRTSDRREAARRAQSLGLLVG